MKTAPDHSTPKLKPRIRAHSPHFPVSDQADGHSHAVHNKVMQELALEPVLWSRRRTFISFTYESSFLVKFLRLTTNIFDPRVGRNLKSPGGGRSWQIKLSSGSASARVGNSLIIRYFFAKTSDSLRKPMIEFSTLSATQGTLCCTSLQK